MTRLMIKLLLALALILGTAALSASHVSYADDDDTVCSDSNDDGVCDSGEIEE
jgi:hypothetical protein